MNENQLGLNKIGFVNLKNVFRNMPIKNLINDIVNNDEGIIGLNGAVIVDTGIFTGRCPNDKYFVDENSSNDLIWWGPINKRISEPIFDSLYQSIIDFFHTNQKTKTYVFDGFAGADKSHALNVRFVAKKAWQAHFVNNMFIRPNENQLDDFEPDFTIINASEFRNNEFQKHGMNSDKFIIFHMGKKIAIIGGTEYGGEMKKGIFSVMHYLLPMKNILSMHCSANVDNLTGDSAVFFGLSGTGKTTLSTNPNRSLIGDDEHGWSDDGIFNFEGGCYAKVINLDKEQEPEIYNAIKEGALLENVVYDEQSLIIDYSDSSKTENTRVSYPIEHIKSSLSAKGLDSVAGHPTKIIFLTCDAYGVLPPVSKLDIYQAMYHFISGYTAKIAGTELGITEPVATFSPCFGGPFLTLHPFKYAELLKDKMKYFNTRVYLVNTGWVGSNAQSGAKRFSLQNTRMIIDHILNETIEESNFLNDLYFGFKVPDVLGGLSSKILSPLHAWDDLDKYHTSAKALVTKFQENFKLYDLGDERILKAGPRITK